MFDWFKNKRSYNNVVPFPNSGYQPAGDSTKQPAPPPKNPSGEEKPAHVFYRLGITDNNRIAFTMGYSEITMSKEGCQQLIDQLTVFMNQLPETEVNDEDDE